MEGRLMPLGIRQDDRQGEKQERDRRVEAPYALVDPDFVSSPKRKPREWLTVVGLIAGSLVLATVLRLALSSLLNWDHPYAFFMIAALVVAWRCGPKAGLLTGAIGLILALLLFTNVEASTSIGTPAGMLGLLIYAFTVVVVSAMFGTLRAARADAERAADLAKEKQHRIEREIEAREQAQDAAREANDQTRRLLDRIAEAMLTLDLDWYVLYANENAHHVLDVCREELVGRRLWEALEAGLSLELKFCLERARKSGLPLTFEIGSDGGQWTEYRAYPSPEGVTLFARNVTEERLTRTALEESEERYRAFLAQSSEAIWRVELERPISTNLSEDEQIECFYRYAYLAECNDTMAKNHGYSCARDLMGKRLELLLPREDPKSIEYLRAFIRSGYKMEDSETAEVDRNGVRHIFLNNLLGMRKDGCLVRAWGTQRDVSRQKQIEAQVRKLNSELERRVEERTLELEAANKELEAFCYSVSHDLRAPLRSVIAQSMMLLEDYAPHLDEGGQAKLKRLVNASKNMAQLIDDLLQLSQLNRVGMARQPVDLTELAESVGAELRTRGICGESRFTIQKNLQADADPGLLKVAMMNLMENACKFAGKSHSPLIEVGRSETDGSIAFYVRDNGVGFDPQYATKIFRPFERLHKADEYPGTGIGLANVARVIERHGGRIWAESQPGEGATFYFTLQ